MKDLHQACFYNVITILDSIYNTIYNFTIGWKLYSWDGRVFLNEEETRLYPQNLSEVPFEAILIKAYHGTKKKHKKNKEFRNIGHTSIQYYQLFFQELLVHGAI